MKVVLFCGGFGLRMRDESENTPKPMAQVGYRPILWHIMKYYAYYGHKDFILCLGYKADVIKDYFINYKEHVTNDFVLSNGHQMELLSHDIQDWTVTFVDTGLHANIGERLMAVRSYLKGEERFLANYADGCTSLPLPEIIDFSEKKDMVGTFVSVKPTQSFHVVRTKPDGRVASIEDATGSGMRINGGYFVFKQEIFDYMRPGEELVLQPFDRLMEDDELYAYPYEGFWACMDTFKEKQMLNDMYRNGDAPWAVWESGDRVKRSVESKTARPNGHEGVHA